MNLESVQRIPILPSLLESLWRLGVAVKNARFARRVLGGEGPRRLPRPVVSVGNIVVGGTGKTPLVEALARTWLRRGGRPGILSRGYRGGPHGNDELRVLERRLPGVPHFQDPNRYRAGEALLAAHGDVDLFILDDGFQHRALHRDLDLVLIDATQPLGNGHCLPRGLLREPWQALERADALILTRAQEASPHKLVILKTFLAERFPGLPLIPVRARYDGLRDPHGVPQEVGERPWAAFAGIGNPTAFFRSLRRLGASVVATRTFPDHHGYREDDLAELRRWAHAEGAHGLICTEKDGVKLEELATFRDREPPILQLRMEYELHRENPLDLLPSR